MKNEIMAFRARMKKRGYKEIHIKQDKKNKCWKITAIEPLGEQTIETYYTAEKIIHTFRF